MDSRAHTSNIETPLYIVLGKIAGIWLLANTGYYAVLPAIGVVPSYNASPAVIGIYFLLWSAFSFFIFLDLFKHWLPDHNYYWAYAFRCLVLGMLIAVLIQALSYLPVPTAIAAHSSDLLVATPKYFFPRAADVLLQQTLVTVLVLSLWVRFRSLVRVQTGYLLIFAGAHILLFMLPDVSAAYAVVMTSAAIITTSIFPYLLLKQRGGFIYNYAIHLVFYIVLAIGLHAWPAPVFI